MKKRYLITAFVAGFVATATLSGCTQVDQVRHNLSQEADNFNIQRKLTVFNNRTDTVLFQMEGRFALDTSERDELEITVQTGPNDYKRHFVRISDETTYVMEDISDGTNTDPYHYELNFLPQWGMKVKVGD